MSKIRLVILSLFLYFVSAASGQGLPNYHTIQTDGPDAIDLYTLGITVGASVRGKSSGPIPFSFGVTVNSVGIADTQAAPAFFLPRSAEAHIGSIHYLGSGAVTCSDGTRTTRYTNWKYEDANGTMHLFPNVTWDSRHCLTNTLTGNANDGSGYSIVIVNTTGVWTVYDRGGGAHTASRYTDTNGNTITATASTWTDAFGLVAVTQTNYPNSTSQIYAYIDAAGNTQQVTVSSPQSTYQSCGGGTTYVWNPITNIAYPDGSSLQFTYQPSAPPNITGGLASIKLRTGATISYTYSACGAANPTLTRTTPDGAWTYVHVLPVGTSHISTTTVTDPSGNDTVYTFADAFEIYRQVYTGHVSGGTLLLSQGTCYNNAAPNCSAQASVTAPFSQIDVYKYIPGVANPSITKTTYDTTYGNVTDVKVYDFGGASPTVETVITYGSYSNGSCLAIGNNINDRPCKIVTKDGAGAVKAQTNIAYDSHGNALNTARLVSGSTYLTSNATYNANGSLATTTDPKGTVTTFSNFACNSLLPQTVFVAGITTSQVWDCNGGVQTSSTDPNGKITTYNFTNGAVGDPFYRVLSVIDPLNNATSYTYTPTTTESVMTFNSGSSTIDLLTTLDSQGRTKSKQQRQSPGSSSFDTVSYTYDVNGRLATVSRPCSTTAGGTCATVAQSFTYDGLNRTTKVSNPGTTGYVQYDYTNKDVLFTLGPQVTGESLKKKQFEHDGLGRLKSVCEITSATGSGACGQAVAATGFKTTYSYDTLGNVTQIQQNAQGSPVQTRSRTYDSLSRMLTQADPESGTMTYTWDQSGAGTCPGGNTSSSSGDLVKTVDAVGTTTCTYYDGLHRVTDVGTSNAGRDSCKRFRYDDGAHGVLGAPPLGVTVNNPAGRLVEAETDTCAVPIAQASIITDEWSSYSDRGELKDFYESTPHSGGYYHTTTTYFANGVPASVGGIPGLSTLTYGVDGEGRPKTALLGSTNLVTNTTFDAGSQPLTVSLGLGESATYHYDPNTGLMSDYNFTVGSTPKTMTGTLTWNANGTLKQLAITDGFNAGGTQTCTYGNDDLIRLTSANCGTPWSQTFSYDPFGNITKSGSLTWQPGYNQATNQYLTPANCQTNGGAPCYDASGNLLTDTFHTYTWNAFNRPVTIDIGTCGTSGSCYTYDALDRVVERSFNNSYMELLYSPLGFAARMGGQTLQVAYASLPGGQRAWLKPTEQRFWFKDWLGTVRLASVRGTRAITYDRAFAPFGEMYATFGATDYKDFTGDMQEDLGLLDLFDTPNRHLHTGQGRWLSPDKGPFNTSNPQTFNRYAYVGNSPLTFTDPTGLWTNAVTFANISQSAAMWNVIAHSDRNTTCIMDGVETDCSLAQAALKSGAARLRSDVGLPSGCNFIGPCMTPVGVIDLMPKDNGTFGGCGPSSGLYYLCFSFTPTNDSAAADIFYKPWVFSWIAPLAGPAPGVVGAGPAGSVAWNPRTHNLCIGVGLGASFGHTASIGPLVTSKGDVDSILSGLSVSGGANFPFPSPTAGLGWQVIANGSGVAQGPTAGVAGVSVSVTGSGCANLW